VHAAAGGQVDAKAAMQQGDPAQGEAQVVGGAEQQVGPQLQPFDVDVGLVEAVEQHQPIGSGGGQARRHGAEVGEKGAELHGQGHGQLGAQLGHDLLQLGLNRGAARARHRWEWRRG
jgi:hypothetical protein